jgi:hypothetical protein
VPHPPSQCYAFFHVWLFPSNWRIATPLPYPLQEYRDDKKTISSTSQSTDEENPDPCTYMQNQWCKEEVGTFQTCAHIQLTSPHINVMIRDA